ncbi:MAG: alpha/beta hydrolase [Actinocatenispora sp.]
MATFVLVPGFWLGGWAWDRVARPLRERGHLVYEVTLTGMAADGDADADVDLDTHVTDLVRLLTDEDLRDVVLVGHSYAGIPVTGAADRRPDRIGRLVYLESGPPSDGMSHADLEPPDAGTVGWTERDTRWIPVPVFDPTEDPVNLAGLSSTDLDLLRQRGVPQPRATSTQPLRLTDPARRALPTDLVSCTFPVETVREMLAAGHPFFVELGMLTDLRVHPLPTGHWPMFSRPADLAGLLDGLGQSLADTA